MNDALQHYFVKYLAPFWLMARNFFTLHVCCYE